MAASNSNHRGASGAGIQLGSAWFQRKINLRPQHRGVHLVTEEILRQMPELGQFSVGLCHVQSKECIFYFLIFFLPLLLLLLINYLEVNKLHIQVSNSVLILSVDATMRKNFIFSCL